MYVLVSKCFSLPGAWLLSLFQRVSALSQSVAKPVKFSAAEGCTFFAVWGWKLVSLYLYVCNKSIESPGGFSSLWSHVGSSRSCLESALHIRRLIKHIHTGMWGGCWKTQWEGMCLVLKQWSWSCFEELWSCVCRELGEITHPNTKWGFLGHLFLKDLKRNYWAEFLLFRVVSSTRHLQFYFWHVVTPSGIKTTHRPGPGLLGSIWRRGCSLTISVWTEFWNCAANQDFDKTCSYHGRVSRITQGGQRSLSSRKVSFSFEEGEQGWLWLLYTNLSFAMSFPMSEGLPCRIVWLWAVSLCHLLNTPLHWIVDINTNSTCPLGLPGIVPVQVGLG